MNHPTICLNMIVRNEAHIVHELLDCIAPYISSWVIVDTGSEDGTQDIIRKHMANLGIPGELHERPWQNFGHNRSEALDLAQGHADYIWVVDADDLVVGTPDFSQLTARLPANCVTALRTASPTGASRSSATGCPGSTAGWCMSSSSATNPMRFSAYWVTTTWILGASGDATSTRGNTPATRDLLLAEMERDPEDARSAFYLAQSYFDLGDFANARRWYQRRAEMGGWEEEVYYSLYRVGQSMLELDEPWPEIQDVFLRAHEFRPTRAESLHAIACYYRQQGRYQLGHLFAQRAVSITLPEEDILFVWAAAHSWAARDELAVCASQARPPL